MAKQRPALHEAGITGTTPQRGGQDGRCGAARKQLRDCRRSDLGLQEAAEAAAAAAAAERCLQISDFLCQRVDLVVVC